MKKKLRICPFCGSDKLSLISCVGGEGSTHYNIYQYKCDYCNSRGPTECTDQKALWAWNGRTKYPRYEKKKKASL